MLGFFWNWLIRVVSDFQALPPTQQITWIFGTVGALTATVVWLGRALRVRSDARGSDDTAVVSVPEEPKLLQSPPSDKCRWEYQWTIGDSVLSRAVEPALSTSIVEEVRRAAASNMPSFLILVRGELGIGKSTLKSILPHNLKEAAKALATDHPVSANFIETCIVLEADDLQPANDFARKVKSFLEAGGAVVALGRPATINVVERRLGRPPDATVTMLPFEPARLLFHDCISLIADKFGLSDPAQRKTLHALAS